MRTASQDSKHKMHARMDAAVPVDAQNAPTATWKTAQNAVSHSAHTHHRQRFTHEIPDTPWLEAHARFVRVWIQAGFDHLCRAWFEKLQPSHPGGYAVFARGHNYELSNYELRANYELRTIQLSNYLTIQLVGVPQRPRDHVLPADEVQQ